MSWRTSLPIAENHLIKLLPSKERKSLLAVCEPFELVLTKVLSEPEEPTSFVYFPTEGFISLVAKMHGSPGLEVGMIGREGMLGVQAVLGVDTSPLHALVQGKGHALRISVEQFRTELANNLPLQHSLHRYLYVLMAQLTASAVCLRFHLIGPRLARWLLMSQDRSHSDSFHVTHEFLAYMLGVRRVGITIAAGLLQHKGLIKYRRGELTVLDRLGLEAAACPCYEADKKIYQELLR